MGSSTRVNEIPEWELANDLSIAYGDLRFVAARVIAIRRRLDPSESAMDALAGVLYHLNQEADKVIRQSEEV